MTEELKLIFSMAFTKGGVQINADAALPFLRNIKYFVDGNGGIKDKILVDTPSRLLDFGEVDPVGLVVLRNLGASLINTPNAPTVTAEGSTGAATWGYRVLAN